MKRHLSIVIIMAMLALLASCGSNVIYEETVSIPCLTKEPTKTVQPITSIDKNDANQTSTDKQEVKDTESIEKKDETKKPIEDVATKLLPKVRKVGRETCIPCATMTKRFKSMSPGLAGKAEFDLIDIDSDPSAIQTYQLQSIPLIIFYDTQGNEIHRQIGVMEESEIIEWLEICGMKR